MFSVLRRVSIYVPSIVNSSAQPSVFCKTLMDPTVSAPKCCGSSQRLVALAQQLRLYKPPPTIEDDESDIQEQRLQESAGKVLSQVGFAESVTPIAHQPERFRPKKAAVLICLFEGDSGEYRVILTKRSSKLSTHSSERIFLVFP